MSNALAMQVLQTIGNVEKLDKSYAILRYIELTSTSYGRTNCSLISIIC
jgi:hypothetical protein